MDNNLLGIAKKAGLLEIGDESVGLAARTRKVKLIMSASDASDGSKRRALWYAQHNGTLHLTLPSTKEELGAVIGRGLPGMIALLDAGLANKYVSTLAQEDPEQYSQVSAQLAVIAERVQKRRKEALAHQRNKRTGKRRTNQ